MSSSVEEICKNRVGLTLYSRRIRGGLRINDCTHNYKQTQFNLYTERLLIWNTFPGRILHQIKVMIRSRRRQSGTFSDIREIWRMEVFNCASQKGNSSWLWIFWNYYSYFNTLYWRPSSNPFYSLSFVCFFQGIHTLNTPRPIPVIATPFAPY